MRSIKSCVSIILVITSCSAPTPPPTITPELSFTPSKIPIPSCTPTNTQTPTFTPTATFTPTQTEIPYQILGRIFPEGYESLGVWANINTGAEDSSDTHFDVGLPNNHVVGKDQIISPASGTIVEVYSIEEPWGYGGEVLTIEPDPPLAGIDELMVRHDIDPSLVDKVWFHLGHIIPLKTSGWVDAGEPIGTVVDNPGIDGVAYVIRVIFISGERQYSPCDLPNKSSFCGICYPGTPYNCP
jgi:hypothetical protein